MNYAVIMQSPWFAYSLMGGLSLAIFLLNGSLPPWLYWFLHIGLVLVCNALTIALAIRRALARPAERSGWIWFTAGVAVSLLGNTAWLVFPAHLGEPGPWRNLLYVTVPASGLLMAVGVWHWPWRGRGERRSLAFLGSLVFCLSFMLLPMVKGVWGSLADPHTPFRIMAVSLNSRLVLAGGLAAFLAAEDPRRLRGPLGWLLLNAVLLFLQLSFVTHGKSLVLVTHSPWLAATPLVTGALLMVPYSAAPAEAPAGGRPLPSHLASFLLHVPFLVATTLMVVSVMAGGPPNLGALFIFLVMTVALVFRQFLLQEQLAAANREMEARVAQRTRQLEGMQDVVLLNERLNSVVVLGAGLVHDLNKGLGTILSAAEVLQMELERRMKVSGFAVEAIIEAVERSAVLSSRVMDFSRRLQEEGGVRDLRRELAALEGLLKLLMPAGVELQLQPGQEPAPVRIHSDDFQQILVNLVGNARDALGGGGRIRVAVGREPGTGEVWVDVEDDGPGISPEIRARMFEPLFTTKDPAMASGLGLASVRILMDRVQGRIDVRSGPGEGTRFRLVFPAQAGQHALVE